MALAYYNRLVVLPSSDPALRAGQAVAATRVGRINGEFIAMPSLLDLEESDLDLIVAGTRKAVTMIEGFSREMTEEDMLKAIEFAQQQIVKVVDTIEGDWRNM